MQVVTVSGKERPPNLLDSPPGRLVKGAGGTSCQKQGGSNHLVTLLSRGLVGHARDIRTPHHDGEGARGGGPHARSPKSSGRER
jgi:hypothetical protein